MDLTLVPVHMLDTISICIMVLMGHVIRTPSTSWTQGPGLGVICPVLHGPMRKIGSKMVTYDETLLCFGGYGKPSGTTQSGAEFTKCEHINFDDGTGWTNEFHAYDLKEGEGACYGYAC